MFKLAKNACVGNSKPIKVDSEAPRKLLKFDPECNHVLEMLGFELVNNMEFQPPDIVRIAGRAQDPNALDRDACMAQLRTSLMFRRLEHAREELCVWAGQIQRQLPKAERKPDYAHTAMGEKLETVLGARGYARRSGSTLPLAASGDGKRSDVGRAYHVLGVPEDAADSLVVWAYTRLMEEDQSCDPLFGIEARRRFDSLVTISAARPSLLSGELSALVANERERGMVPIGAVQEACTALFGAPQSDADAIGSDTIREVLLARLAEAAGAKAQCELVRHVGVLADAKQDQLLKEYAASVLVSIETAGTKTPTEGGSSVMWNDRVDTWQQLPVGLKNIGNTCYLNSILQCLFSIVPIRQAVLCVGDGATWNEELRLGRCDGGRMLDKDDIEAALKFVRMLKALFEALVKQRVEGWTSAKTRKSSGGYPLAAAAGMSQLAVTPDRELADMLLLRIGKTARPVSATIGATYFPAGGQNTSPQQQQDVDECMAQCVGLLVRALPPRDMESVGDSSDNTWIHRLLAGHLELATERLGSGSGGGDSDKPQTDAFLNLNLNIPAETTDINECINGFFAPSIIGGGDMVSSESAGMAVPETGGGLVRCTRLKDAPPVLCIQVQRVQFDMATMRPFKINSHLRLRPQISLAPYKEFSGDGGCQALYQRIAAIKGHLRALHVPVQSAANDGTSVSVVSALERAQAFMMGIGRWATIDEAQILLGELPQSADTILQNAQEVSLHLERMLTTLGRARDQWEQELKELQMELERVYDNVPGDDPMSYTLHAVFVHSGETPEFGHYWVYIRDVDKANGRVRWLKFNDSVVSVAEEADIFRHAPKPGEESANPYYLVFVRTVDVDATVDIGV